jgi:rubredoxin
VYKFLDEARFISGMRILTANIMAEYVCSTCGYIYGEEEEGILFEDLPEDWECPVCGDGKDVFELK